MSYLVSAICATYGWHADGTQNKVGQSIVLLAAFMTFVMTAAITFYACTTKDDITLCGTGMIVVLIIALLCLTIMLIFVQSPALLAIIICLMLIIYGFFLLYDT